MIESTVVDNLRADGTIADIVSTYSTRTSTVPAVFSDQAPEDAEKPYIVVTVASYPVPDYAIDAFDIFVHYYERGESGAKARAVAREIEIIFDGHNFDSDWYTTIRFYRRHGTFAAEADPLERHYIKQLYARASRKGWMEQLP